MSTASDLHCYVYQHVDPVTGEVVYVGCGSGGRAWVCGSARSTVRSPLHAAWVNKHIEEGLLPTEWVRIVEKDLEKSQAKALERLLIHELKPIFNKDIRNQSNMKFNVELYNQAVVLRDNGATYYSIAKQLGVSPMTVHAGLNGRRIVLETLLNE